MNDTSPSEIYTLSLHDALPIFIRKQCDGVCESLRVDVSGRERLDERCVRARRWRCALQNLYPLVLRSHLGEQVSDLDRKSTRLNSSHQIISYAVFCLKKKNISR